MSDFCGVWGLPRSMAVIWSWDSRAPAEPLGPGEEQRKELVGDVLPDVRMIKGT